MTTGLAWITGASSGLGRALALKMAHEGWRVAITARSEGALAEVAGEAAHGRIVPYPCDTTDANAMADTVARIEADLGAIDIAVFNAGTHQPVHAADLEADTFRKLVEVNVFGTLNGFLPVFAAMKARRVGQIAVVASVAGYRGLPTSAAYGLTKAGLINFTEALRPEAEMMGIRLQLVCPGFVKTPLTARNDFPMPFLIEVEDAADAFYKGLMSDRFEIVFPRVFGWLMKLYRMLPYPLALMLARRMVPEEAAKAARATA
ncbi:SDR family NAD(P)-dependent oxidoreductase [Futiania mangrovi]|uniref:SDR family NAD(P)-dependent oxidoreductase n=1 Tax=Futiania mangrovi TaxID=2959716 RepID=A0A9J6PI11_9PROT|nr:SDR family NAD(P)-dependent oxidoreductase [Futiania mangrovii]MCP1335722.1 SDR family NAD(P)-dependent oxidoreductase [Futiania mangrovii]